MDNQGVPFFSANDKGKNNPVIKVLFGCSQIIVCIVKKEPLYPQSIKLFTKDIRLCRNRNMIELFDEKFMVIADHLQQYLKGT